MKITIIGAGGVRTPLLVKAISRLENVELSLMDTDEDHLRLISYLISEQKRSNHVRISGFDFTTDAEIALRDADYVVTTFRAGGMEARIIDEKVPLKYNILGQETTGAGGFAMAARSIPVLKNYVELMKRYCPEAWIINFANPSGLLSEYIINTLKWEKTIGICDAPSTMHSFAASFIGADKDEVFLDYFGLNHLGWVKSIYYKDRDLLPGIIQKFENTPLYDVIPFSYELLNALGMIPNEYLYYYYSSIQSINHIKSSGYTRGEYLAKINKDLFEELMKLSKNKAHDQMWRIYQKYLYTRQESYMRAETATNSDHKKEVSLSPEGYGGVALGVIQSLEGISPGIHIVNVKNSGAIHCMNEEDIVEIPAMISKGNIQALPTGKIPDHCIGLMKQVKAFEKATISAIEGENYSMALYALSIHPLIQDEIIARKILDQYIVQHASTFPRLKK